RVCRATSRWCCGTGGRYATRRAATRPASQSSRGVSSPPEASFSPSGGKAKDVIAPRYPSSRSTSRPVAGQVAAEAEVLKPLADRGDRLTTAGVPAAAVSEHDGGELPLGRQGEVQLLLISAVVVRDVLLH